ncbi:MAG: TetR/AcrR family transcriptional regulator, mexJK operon transcriptional repressor [Actinomycetota bacterium]|nr:TetR/AcrR family transcriptional regulator, mexJK operon transcriptional repressor [Actinomycetota bacterium]
MRAPSEGLSRASRVLTPAAQFNWLVVSAPLNQAMLLGDYRPPDPSELAGWADDGVRTFLAAYGAPA